MKFKSERDRIMINRVLAVAYVIVPRIVKNILEEAGFQIENEGKGMELVYTIKSNAKELNAKLYFHNLFLEIVTKDRDAFELEFDEKLFDLDYFLAKTISIVKSKLTPILIIMEAENIEKGIEKLQKIAGNYERLNIWKSSIN